MSYAAKLIQQLKESDLDLYDKSGFLRFRMVDSDAGKTIRVWKSNQPFGELSEQQAVDFIESRAAKGLSEKEDYVFI